MYKRQLLLLNTGDKIGNTKIIQLMSLLEKIHGKEKIYPTVIERELGHKRFIKLMIHQDTRVLESGNILQTHHHG